MTRMFAGEPIPGLAITMNRVLEDSHDGPVEYQTLVTLLRRDFDDPQLPHHVEWMAVNDPRVVRNGKRIRRYTGPASNR